MAADGSGRVVIEAEEFRRLMREDGGAARLACYVLGVLSGRGPHRGALELIRKRCEAAVAQPRAADGRREG